MGRETIPTSGNVDIILARDTAVGLKRTGLVAVNAGSSGRGSVGIDEILGAKHALEVKVPVISGTAEEMVSETADAVKINVRRSATGPGVDTGRVEVGGRAGIFGRVLTGDSGLDVIFTSDVIDRRRQNIRFFGEEAAQEGFGADDEGVVKAFDQGGFHKYGNAGVGRELATRPNGTGAGNFVLPLTETTRVLAGNFV